MQAILSAIESGTIKNVKPSVVISNSPNAPGLIVASEKFKIPSIVVLKQRTKGWDYDQRIVSVLREYGVTPESGLICLAGFMRIISPEFVRLYKMHIMNIHPALLPSFAGLHAQKQAIEYGVKVAGLQSILWMKVLILDL